MSNQNAVQILTPVGRLVQGDCFDPQTKDAEGKPLVIKTGPNAGQPRVSYFMALAIPKTDPGYNELWAAIHGVARAEFPSLFDAAGNCINPEFAFKVTDGDSVKPNAKGVKPCDREGFPGHWVLNFSDGFAPKVYTANGAELITNPLMLKRGYYIRISGNIKGNGSMQQPGIFLNHSMVELVGYGEEIITGPNGDVFGQTPAAALPPGASATPLAGATPLAATPMPGVVAPMPGVVAPVPGAAAPMPGVVAPVPGAAAPMPGVVAPMPGAAAVQPAHDFVQGPAAAPAEVKYLDANGVAFTEAQLLTAGFQPAQIAALPRA